MREKSVIIMGLFSLFTCLLLIAGLGWALVHHFSDSTSYAAPPAVVEAPKVEQDGLAVIALGDSLTVGTGDNKGKGYVGYLIDYFKEEADQPITFTNLGIKGLRADKLAEQVKQTEVQRQVEGADVILMTIGGNDLFLGGQTLIDLDVDRIKQMEDDYAKNLDSILSDIRSVNNKAIIYFIGLYNPFIDLEDAEITTNVVRDWNYRSSQVSAKYPKTVFVPTFDLFQLNVNNYLFSDKFHPNAEGYRLIAERVGALITW